MSTAAARTRESGARPLRADARRNRERILEAAVAAFAAGRADVTLDGVARAAGVGIGTLYRHFPTREALVDAAYLSELARLCDGAPHLVATLPPDAALRTWMDRFVDYAMTKRGMAEALRALVASGGNPFADSRSRLTASLELLVGNGVRAGVLRGDVAVADVLAGLSGVTLAAGEPAQRAQAGRLLDLLLDGLRFSPSAARPTAGTA